MNNAQNYNILAVDDEEEILELLKYNLKKSGFNIQCVSDGEQALDLVRRKNFDLIILDRMLPGLEGTDICRILKNDPSTENLPILMLTAKVAENDIVSGLNSGADDYVNKPFSINVLIARVHSLLRRHQKAASNSSDKIIIRNLTIIESRREIRVDNVQVELTFTEFQILLLFARNPNLVFTRNQIISAIRGDDYPVTDRSVDFQITRLRKKIGSAGLLINTVRGVGYRILLPDEP